MLLMIAGTTVMFASCDSNTTASSEETVVETDTVGVETQYEVERTSVEVDTTTETETVEVEQDDQQQ